MGNFVLANLLNLSWQIFTGALAFWTTTADRGWIGSGLNKVTHATDARAVDLQYSSGLRHG
jgi:hypothetical protein